MAGRVLALAAPSRPFDTGLPVRLSRAIVTNVGVAYILAPEPSRRVYLSLDASKVIATVERLARRIHERFPKAGLASVAGELERVARDAVERSRALTRPNYGLRAGSVALLGGLIVLLTIVVPQLRLSWKVKDAAELIQTLGSLCEAMIVIGGAILFLVTLESRLKREQALRAVHELRALAHIVDMHQLTKDPEQLLLPGPRTDSSPVRHMSPFELQRYLDYSSEMLALISKVGAFYAQHLKDPVVLAAVDEVEELTNGLSRKVWQKIAILDQILARRDERARATSNSPSQKRALALDRGTSGSKLRRQA
jgi:hypothetical protein